MAMIAWSGSPTRGKLRGLQHVICWYDRNLFVRHAKCCGKQAWAHDCKSTCKLPCGIASRPPPLRRMTYAPISGCVVCRTSKIAEVQANPWAEAAWYLEDKCARHFTTGKSLYSCFGQASKTQWTERRSNLCAWSRLRMACLPLDLWLCCSARTLPDAASVWVYA